MIIRPRCAQLTRFGAVLLAIALTGCATLPTSGPTVGQVNKDAKTASSAAVPYTVVNLDADTARLANASQGDAVAQMAALAADPAPDRADLIRRGDTLAIGVFEVGVSLFAGGSGSALSADPSRAPTASTQNFVTQVREDGSIDLPFVGVVPAAGTYPESLAETIKSRLQKFSEHPAVTVGITESLRNVVYVGGAVTRAGRFRLSAGHERLLDVLALAGGSPFDVNEIQVTLARGDRTAVAPLNQISPGDKANVRLLAGDRIELERVRQTYSVFGASERVSQVSFEARSVNLAEAIARVGGPADYRANPRGVYLFRFEKGADGTVKAMVYQVNMLKPETYFLAQTVAMHDKDVLVFANASSNFAQKMFGLIAQLFNPFISLRTATQ
jgi:polysaccharide export outer membrane protein